MRAHSEFYINVATLTGCDARPFKTKHIHNVTPVFANGVGRTHESLCILLAITLIRPKGDPLLG